MRVPHPERAMSNPTKATIAIATIAALTFAFSGRSMPAVAAAPSAVPAPLIDNALAPRPGEEVAVFAGGCFWGIQAVYQHVKGVKSAVSGYTGGSEPSPNYQQVSSGRTGHAESVRIVFDPSKVSYGTLLRVLFAVAHDPTQLNRQGPDVGEHYRSEIFFTNAAQKKIATAYIDQLGKAKIFSRPIVTRISSLGRFTVAEDYHQNYANEHPNEPYIRFHDAPKVEALKTEFASIYKEELSAWK
jgi:peptide-methionine (S)-S-oxide reductase